MHAVLARPWVNHKSVCFPSNQPEQLYACCPCATLGQPKNVFFPSNQPEQLYACCPCATLGQPQQCFLPIKSTGATVRMLSLCDPGSTKKMLSSHQINLSNCMHAVLVRPWINQKMFSSHQINLSNCAHAVLVRPWVNHKSVFFPSNQPEQLYACCPCATLGQPKKCFLLQL